METPCMQTVIDEKYFRNAFVENTSSIHHHEYADQLREKVQNARITTTALANHYYNFYFTILWNLHHHQVLKFTGNGDLFRDIQRIGFDSKSVFTVIFLVACKKDRMGRGEHLGQMEWRISEQIHKHHLDAEWAVLGWNQPKLPSTLDCPLCTSCVNQLTPPVGWTCITYVWSYSIGMYTHDVVLMCTPLGHC